MSVRENFFQVLFVRKEVLSFHLHAQDQSARGRETHTKESTFPNNKKYLKRANRPKGRDAKLRGLKP